MNVAIIMPSATQTGGAEKFAIDMVRAGRDTEVRWSVLFLEDGPMVAEFNQLGVGTRIIPATKFSDIPDAVKVALKISAFCQQHDIRFVLGWMTKGHTYGALSRVLGNPARPILFQHGYSDQPDGFDKLIRFLPVDGVFGCSRFVLEKQLQLLRRKVPGFVGYPGVDVDQYSPDAVPSMEACRAKLGLPQGIPIIGSVGRLQHWKGMHTLVDALPKIRQRYPEAQMVLVGGVHELESDYKTRLHARIRETGQENLIHMVGLQRNIPEWMQAMTVFVHASHIEPFGMVVIEAMALGKPVVAGAAGGPREIITPGEDGLFAGFEDSDAVAEGVIRYLSDPEWSAEVGRKAHARAQTFSLQHCADRIISGLRDLSAVRNPESPVRV